MIFYNMIGYSNKSIKIFATTFFLLCFLFTNIAKAQFDYAIDGTVTNGKRKLEGAQVALLKGSTVVQQVTTGANGKFSFKLDAPNANYTVTVTKGGYITKKFVFSTFGVPDDVAKAYEGGVKPEISIFEYPKDPSIVSQINSILSQPMAKFTYDDRVKDIVQDKAYTQSMLDALDRLNKIEKDAIDKQLEEEKKQQNLESAAASQYQAAIAKADAAFAKKDYTTAKAAYQDALTFKKEQYPVDKIKEIEQLIADQAKNAQLDADYKAAIARGDAALATKTYEAAKAGYNDALKLKPAEAYPKTKLAEIDAALAKLAGEKELNAKYDAAIAKADKAFAAKTYDAAKAGYNEALGLKATEKYPKDQITAIDKLLADAAAKDKADKELNAKYDAAIAKADKAFGAKDYTNAKGGYTEASGLKPAEAYPKTKLAEIDKLLGDAAAKEAAEKELNAKYAAAIAKADKALAAKTYPDAKAAYTEALGLKSAEQYPKDKIAEIDKILADLAAKDAAEKDKLAKEKELNDKYNAAIAKGDKAFGTKDYATAKAGYTEASGLKPAEQYPKDKLAEIEKAIADAAKATELEGKYKAAIAKADAAMKAKTYDAAKAGYNEALTYKSSEQYPKDQLAAIDALLAKDSAAKELNDKYNAAITKADAAFTAKTYDAAESGYNEALGLKPAEAYPKTKLAEIDKILADLAAKDAATKDAAAKAAELEAKYKAAIAKADASLGTKDYVAAKASYNEALTYKATEQYPKDKIKEIDAILAKEMGAKQLEEKYTAAIAKADKALGTKDYTNAKAGYNEALGLKPAEQYPKDKLAEIEKALADAANAKDAAAKAAELEAKYKAAVAKGDAGLKAKTYDASKAAYNEALGFKPAEQYPKDKIAEIDALLAKEMGAKELDAKYADAIAKADAALKTKDYTNAKVGYNEALGYKPAEAYPKAKLAEIEKALADAANKDAAEKDRLAKEKELNEKYAAAIAKGDAAFGTKDYPTAKAAYTDATGLKPAEKYPKDKLAEINAILAKEMGAKELEKKYAEAIKKGDDGLGAKDYATAKTQYTTALALKPTEQYPKDKLAEIEKALADLAAAKDKDAAAKALEAKYLAAIAKADKAFAAKTYAAAKTSYEEASGIKPGEQYPKDKIAEIEKLMGDAASEKDRLALEAKYKAAIAKADKALTAKTYDAAKAGYNEALGIKSDEQYPKDKIAEIDKILADLANKNASAKELEEKYKAAIAKGDAALATKNYDDAKARYNEALTIKANEKYPKDKLAEIDALIAKDASAKEMDAKFKAAIAKADDAFGTKDYATAKASYTEASGYKPNEQYPKDQLVKLNAILSDLSKNKALQDKYDAAIKKADDLLAGTKYNEAIAAYNAAQAIKPDEPYPANKITEINHTLDGLARAKEREKEYADLIAKGDKLFGSKDYKQSKSAFQDALLIKSSEKYPKDKIAEIDALMKNKNTAVTTSNNNKDDFKSDLAKKYPEGITEETGRENNAKVTRRIVVKGNEGHLYIRKETNFGPIYYFKDDVPITENVFLNETEVQNPE